MILDVVIKKRKNRVIADAWQKSILRRRGAGPKHRPGLRLIATP
jgi:hypothetical protein